MITLTNMKKIALLFLIACFAISCSNDDGDNEPKRDSKLNAALIGQWENVSDPITYRRNYLFTEDFNVSFFIKDRETGYTTSISYRDVPYKLKKEEVYYSSDGNLLLTYYAYHKDTLYINGKDSTRIYKRIE